MVLETTTFRLADRVSDDVFLHADEGVRTGFLYRQPGLVRATTARGDGGEWIMVVLWASQNEADAAAARAATDPGTTELMALVDQQTHARRRYSTPDRTGARLVPDQRAWVALAVE